MKFKSFTGKQVMVRDKILTFTSEEYETEDKDEIKALEGAKNVEKVEGRKARAKAEE